jgi:hypothetical protein
MLQGVPQYAHVRPGHLASPDNKYNVYIQYRLGNLVAVHTMIANSGGRDRMAPFILNTAF